MNVPYVKQFNEKGELTNPIKGIYPQPFENRHTRRLKEARFANNRKSAQIQVLGGKGTKQTKYRKVLQRFFRKDGTIGIVKHYLSN
jgi:hypothetical protein